MRKSLSAIFEKFSILNHKLSKKLYISNEEERVKKWYENQGNSPFTKKNDKNLRYDYNLEKNSLVFDVGGYIGQWTSDISSMYCCTIYVFEPVKEFANRIEKRFALNKKIKLFKFGLGGKSEIVEISVDNDASSIYKNDNEKEKIRIVDIIDFIQEYKITTIDLFKINIEGGEYGVLNRLLDYGFVKNIKNFQIQFHDFVENAEEKSEHIQKELSKTHYLTYKYPWIWENWRLRSLKK